MLSVWQTQKFEILFENMSIQKTSEIPPSANTAGTRWCSPWENLFLDRFCDFQTVFLIETQKVYLAL